MVEWSLACAVMTKTFFFKTKKKGNGGGCKADDEYPGYARMVKNVTNRHYAIQVFNSY